MVSDSKKSLSMALEPLVVDKQFVASSLREVDNWKDREIIEQWIINPPKINQQSDFLSWENKAANTVCTAKMDLSAG